MLGLSLVACSSNSGGQKADCLKFQDSASALLDSYYKIESTPYPMKTNIFGDVSTDTSGAEKKAARLAKLLVEWSNRVLDAPDGCFTESDINNANSYKSQFG